MIDRGTGGPPVGPPAIYFYLLDASYNVVGLTDAAGTVLVQYTFEPYGTPAILDELVAGPLPTNRLGHQGLFFERLYAAAAESLLTTPALAPRSLDPSAPSVGLYHNRNRWLSPELGRFLQRDPNETTLPIVTAIAFNGDALAIVLGVFDPQGHYGDGLNLYAYLGSNPLNLRDPLGLVFDPFEDVDDLIGQLTGERAAAAHHAMAMIGGMAQTVAIMALQTGIAVLFPPYGLYLSITGAAGAFEDMLYNGVSYENAAVLGLSLAGVRGTYGPSMAMGRRALGRLTASVRSGYGSAARAYTRMGLSGSGFGSPRARGVQSCRPRGAYHKGIWFDEFGFPDFGPHVKPGCDVRISPSGTRAGDYAAANRAAGHPEWGSKPPDGFRWHHHQDVGRMQLVPRRLHEAVGHDGGWLIWGRGS